MQVLQLIHRNLLYIKCSHVPTEVVIAESKTAGLWSFGCEPLFPQSGRVPVNALCPCMADAPRATVPSALPQNTSLVGVCGGEKKVTIQS